MTACLRCGNHIEGETEGGYCETCREKQKDGFTPTLSLAGKPTGTPQTFTGTLTLPAAWVKGLVWSSEKPDRRGWFWCRPAAWSREFGSQIVLLFHSDANGIMQERGGYITGLPDGFLWAGPIPEPLDQPKEEVPE